jgi:hypothetical protein
VFNRIAKLIKIWLVLISEYYQLSSPLNLTGD